MVLLPVICISPAKPALDKRCVKGDLAPRGRTAKG